MDIGLELMNKCMNFECGYVLPSPSSDGFGYRPKPLIHDDASILPKTIFRQLRDPFFPTSLLPHPRVAEAYWTEHGGRSFIPTAGASMGLCKQELDLLGCWKPQGSTKYVRREVGNRTASNIMAWMMEAGISEDQAQAQADRLRLKSIPSGTAPIRPSYTFGVSGIKGASTPSRGSSGSEGDEEASVMEPEPQAAMASSGGQGAGSDSDERGGKGEDHAAAHRGAAQELPEETDTRPRCGHRPQHRPPPIAPLRRFLSSSRMWTNRFSVFSFVGKKLPSDSTYDLYCRRRWSASAPIAGPATSDSDGTSEVSPESELWGSKRGRSHFFWDNDG